MYGWEITEKLPLVDLRGFKKHLNFMKISSKTLIKKTDKGNNHEVEVELPDKLHELHNNLTFLTELFHVEKLVTNSK